MKTYTIGTIDVFKCTPSEDIGEEIRYKIDVFTNDKDPQHIFIEMYESDVIDLIKKFNDHLNLFDDNSNKKFYIDDTQSYKIVEKSNDYLEITNHRLEETDIPKKVIKDLFNKFLNKKGSKK